MATGLIALGLLPILARRLAALATEGAGAPGDTSLAVLLPALVHVVFATVFVVLGAFQFSPALRRRRPAWHRVSGRIVVVAGLVVALSGLWINQFAPRTEGPNELLYAFRVLFGLGMVFSLAWGLRAILRRELRSHRAWMIRAYAIGLGAGTQPFTIGFGQAVFGTGEVSEALLNAAGWVVNLAVAELVIRRGGTRPRRRPGASGARPRDHRVAAS
ncbi:DUF2306 domain-containing protein [Naasia sp. SYSU D00948]|uniref:DUF2306 domain-containing protein n=1 Tax=Naasia sp. SYSU D00948 TaxID=2817379 RepID=UPI001B30CFE0|nr:DUF2306 domain-containing protein [Naasia sp. SYSU D00948]